MYAEISFQDCKEVYHDWMDSGRNYLYYIFCGHYGVDRTEFQISLYLAAGRSGLFWHSGIYPLCKAA